MVRSIPLFPAGLTAALFAAFALVAFPAAAKKDEIYTGSFSNKAVGGYDAVAYFTDGKPVKGSSDYTFRHKGAVWFFANQQNLDTFKADPDAYTPQYGGYCAWAVAQGKLAKGDPRHWHIKDGRLYLNYSRSINETWLKDVPGYIQEADKNWPQILG